MGAGPTRALTGGRRTKPTSTGCRRLRQPEPGRRSTYQAGEPVQTNRASSVTKSDNSDFGLGDINPTAFFVTSLRRDLLVGFGPTVTLPTATEDDLGTQKWSRRPGGGRGLDAGPLGGGFQDRIDRPYGSAVGLPMG